jgi:PAS domain S-box-containing protein
MRDTPEVDKGLILSELLDGIFICKKSGEVVYSNPVFAKMLGYSSEAISAKNLAKEIIERELEWKALVSLLEQGSVIQDYEIRFKKADGSRACISLSATNFRDDSGIPIGLVAVARDISTRKGVENELREKAFRIDVMNRIARLVSSSMDVRTALQCTSEELRKLMSYDQIMLGITEEKGRHVEIIVPDQADSRQAKPLGKVLYEGSIVEKLRFGKSAIVIEKEANRKLFAEFEAMDSSKFSSMLAVPLTSRGRILGALTVAHSKPGEYNWESAETLEMVADQLAGLLDSIVLFKTLEHKIKLADGLIRSGVELQKAITTEQIYAAISSHIRDVVEYNDLSFYLVDLQRKRIYPVYAVGLEAEATMAADGGLDEGIVGIVARTGKAEFVDDVDADPRSADVPGTAKAHNAMLAIPLMGPDRVLGVLELYRNKGNYFSQQDLEAGLLFAQQASIALSNARLVSKLQEANKEIEMLNDLMFHDINNYNFATLNYIDAIATSKDVPEAHKPFLEKSLQLIRQNAKLIENVKKLTKIGVMNANDFVPVNLSDVLRKVASALQTSSPGKRVTVTLKLPESDAYIMANSLVEELFMNLMNNSVKYDPHEEVELEAECAKTLEDGKPVWKVSVADHGYGIPDDLKAKLFQKYVRLKPDPKIQGTGLGLSICKALADKFAGRIWVEDRVPGKSELGSKFCVVFSAAKPR